MNRNVLRATGAIALMTAAAMAAQVQAAAPAARPAAAAPAPAAAAAPAPAANIAPPTGAPIAGLCLFSYDRAIGNSTVGKAYVARMQQLTAQVQAELNPERTAIETEGNTLQTQRASLTQDQLQQRVTALQTRAQTYSQKEELRARELEETKNQQLQKIANAINPLLASVYTSRNCAAVFDQGALLAANPAMDITDAVTQQLNTKMTTITFERTNLAAAAAAPAR
jgi:Skp family chaperone for outer membrane proteins